MQAELQGGDELAGGKYFAADRGGLFVVRRGLADWGGALKQSGARQEMLVMGENKKVEHARERSPD